MASRLANLLVNIPKHKGQCYQAVAKLFPDRRLATRKPSRSCCRYPRSRSNSSVDLASHVRSYSQPAIDRKRNCLAGEQVEHVSRRNKSDQLEHAEEVEEMEEMGARAEEDMDDRTFYYDAPDKDRRLYESARELSTQDRMVAMNQAPQRQEVSEPETVQYELEATRPREPIDAFDVFEHFSNMHRTRDQRMVPHLQPSNLRPFGSTNTLISPTLTKSSSGIKYPVYDTHEAHSTGTVAKSGDRDSDDMQRREFSTYKHLRAKENPGYRPTNKMSLLVKPKERNVEESEEQASSNDNTVETSAELKRCNEIIEKQRELNAKYYLQKIAEPPVERKLISTTSSLVEKYKFPKPTVSKTSNTEQSNRKKFEIGNRKPENAKTFAPQQTECKDEKVSAAREQRLPWPERDAQRPATVRSTLPINILQTTASPEDLRIREKVRLGPNQKLAVPWPAYSERMIPKKRGGLSVVYPALSTTDVLKSPPKGDCLDTRTQIQTRGISTDNNFRIDAGLFSNDCRLRHVLCKKEVVDSILQKSNAFKENLCRSKIGSIPNDFSSARYSSSSSKKITHKHRANKRRQKRVICKVAINKNRYRRKHLPGLKPSNCPCVDPEPLKDVKIKKLKARYVAEPKKVCPKPCSERHARADAGLTVKQKELPLIVVADCPCVEKFMKDAPKIKRLIPKKVYEPKKVCPVPCKDRHERADADLVIEPKELPSIDTDDCPCPKPERLKDVRPLNRLDLYVPQPKRIRPKKCSERTPRADQGLQVKSKELPRISSGDCPCIESSMKDAPKLKRLIPKMVYEPKKVCVVPCKDRHERADADLIIEPKELPLIDTTDCPCPKPTMLKDVRPLNRLDLYVPQPKRIRPKKCSERTPRADQGLQVKSKELPMITSGDCPCIESSMKDAPKLKRLIAKMVYEPKKVCVVPCKDRHERADADLIIEPKELPLIDTTDCPCPKPTMLKDVRPLNRLDLYVPQPKRIRPKKCSERTPRADQGLQVKSKELPRISSGDCPCIESSMKDAPKLKRLIPKPVFEPRKKCPVPCREANLRADHKRRKRKRKALPTLIPVDCPCHEPKPLRDVAPLGRLDLYVSEPKRIRPKKCSELTPRADAYLKVKRKKLPIVDDADCPSPDLNVLKPGRKLARPKFKGIREPEKCPPPVPYCSLIPRSDDDDWEYFVPEGCDEYFESEYLESSQKPSSNRLQPDVKFRRDYSTYIPYNSPPGGVSKMNIKAGVYNGIQTCRFHTQRASDRASPVFPKSPFKDALPWTGIVKNSASSTANATIKHGITDEPECFFRRPISTSNFMQAAAARDKKKCGRRKAKCAKFSLPGCSPKARTSCERKPMVQKCVRQSSPYPAFSEVTDTDVETMECECTKIDYLQPKNPIIKQVDRFQIPPPHQGHIDPTLEDRCVRQKLGLPPDIGTAVCSTTIVKKRLKQKDFLDKFAKMDEPPDEKPKKGKKGRKCPKSEKCNSEEFCCLSGEDKKAGLPSAEQQCFSECCKVIQERERLKNMTLWERIVDYFRARPDCPSPEEFKKKRLREKAEKAAAEAGLCVYDPQEMCKVKDLPKIITAKDVDKDYTDEKSDKDEEELCDDQVKASPKKCKKRTFSCSGKGKDSKPDFPKTECPEKVEKKCKSKKVEKSSVESLCDTLKQCLSSGGQKRKYSTYNTGHPPATNYILNDLIYADDKTKEYLLTEAAPIIDALIDQGYPVAKNSTTNVLKSINNFAYNNHYNTDDCLSQTETDIHDSYEVTKSN